MQKFIINIELKNGRWLINGRKYQDCTPIEQNAFNHIISENKNE